ADPSCVRSRGRDDEARDRRRARSPLPRARAPSASFPETVDERGRAAGDLRCGGVRRDVKQIKKLKRGIRPDRVLSARRPSVTSRTIFWFTQRASTIPLAEDKPRKGGIRPDFVLPPRQSLRNEPLCQ